MKLINIRSEEARGDELRRRRCHVLVPNQALQPDRFFSYFGVMKLEGKEIRTDNVSYWDFLSAYIPFVMKKSDRSIKFFEPHF